MPATTIKKSLSWLCFGLMCLVLATIGFAPEIVLETAASQRYDDWDAYWKPVISG